VSYVNGYSGTTSEVNSTTQFAYASDVISSDLINGLTPITIGWNTTQQASPLELNDGIHGLGFSAVSGDNVQGAWTTVGATATYNLGTGANGLGYDITSVQSIADWENVRFGNQNWTLAVRLVGSSSFVNVATVDYQPITTANSGIGTTKVTMSNLNLTNIEYFRVTAASVNSGTNAGAFVWRELDVSGISTIPEPSAAALLGLSALAMRRRR
jgi:hypothetical protein